MKRIGPLAAAAATALVLVAAACGGGGGGEALSKDQYSQKVSSIGSTLGESFDTLSSEANSLGEGDVATGDDLTKLTQGLADAAQKGVDSLTEAAEELEAAEPPADAEAANDRLAQGLHALADRFQDVVDALESGDLAEVLDIGAALQDVASSEAGATIQQAIDELEAKGYEVEGAG